MGARGGMIAPDQTTFDYLEGRLYAPKALLGIQPYWKTLKQMQMQNLMKKSTFDIEPMITYGTNPGMGLGISKSIPDSKDVVEGEETYAKSLGYMGFQQGEAMIGKQIDYVFLGSCTNGRIEDFRASSKGTKQKQHATSGSRIACCGSTNNRRILDILTDSGFVLRQPGCSACLAMNDDSCRKICGKYFQQEF
jgi:3-isopropylmalate/(R)-2-methylmalate dehydratase large subunit